MYMIVRALAEIFSAATRLGGSVRDVTFRFGIGGLGVGEGFRWVAASIPRAALLIHSHVL